MPQTPAGPTGSPRIVVSVVVPMHNEEEALDRLFARLEPALKAVTKDYEIVCVDDGSTDGTLSRLVDHRTHNGRIKVLSLSRNFGKDVALSAGLDHAAGDAVIPIDADLQDPPELIPAMVARWQEGFDVVYARRSARTSDTLPKRFLARAFYRVHNAMADVRIPFDTGDFRLMDRRVVDALRTLPERNRFMKGLFAWVGFRQTGIDYERPARQAGTTKWNTWRLWNFALDGITASSTWPLRVWTYFGLTIALTAFAYGGFLVLRTLIHGVDVPGYASIMSAILFLGGLNILATGVIGEYLGRVLIEVRHRPLYLVRETHGMGETDDPAILPKASSDGPRRIRSA